MSFSTLLFFPSAIDELNAASKRVKKIFFFTRPCRIKLCCILVSRALESALDPSFILYKLSLERAFVGSMLFLIFFHQHGDCILHEFNLQPQVEFFFYIVFFFSAAHMTKVSLLYFPPIFFFFFEEKGTFLQCLPLLCFPQSAGCASERRRSLGWIGLRHNFFGYSLRSLCKISLTQSSYSGKKKITKNILPFFTLGRSVH